MIDGMSNAASGLRSMVSISSVIFTLLGGGTTVWWWAKRKSRWNPNVETELHGMDGFLLFKEEMIAIIKNMEAGVSLWANRDRLYFKCSSQADPFIRVFFNVGKLVADIYCDIDLKDVPANLTANFPDARLDAASQFGTVVISLQSSHELAHYQPLFMLALLSGRRKS